MRRSTRPHRARRHHHVSGSQVGARRRRGRVIRLKSDPHVGEAAITVVDDMHQLGIGSALAVELARAARARGIRVIRAEVLEGNAAMRESSSCRREAVDSGDQPGRSVTTSRSTRCRIRRASSTCCEGCADDGDVDRRLAPRSQRAFLQTRRRRSAARPSAARTMPNAPVDERESPPRAPCCSRTW